MTTIEIKHNAEWLALRKLYGGGSEAAALFDVGYESLPTKWSLWAWKSGKLPPSDLEDDDRVAIGKLIEPVIAQLVTRKRGWDLERVRQYVIKDGPDGKPDERLRMGATLDYIVREHEDGPGIVECKNRDYLQWVQHYTNDAPSQRDIVQVAHQLSCMPECQWAAVAVLVGGNDLKVYTFKRSTLAPIIRDVEAAWADLWQRVASGDEPSLTGDDMPAWLETQEFKPAPALYIDDGTIEGDGGFDDLVDRYLISNGTAKQHAKIADDAKAKILQRLEAHEHAQSNRHKIKATYTKVAASVVRLPDLYREILKRAAIVMRKSPLTWMGLTPEQIATDLDSIEGWSQETRKASIRTTLKIEHYERPQPDADVPAATPISAG